MDENAQDNLDKRDFFKPLKEGALPIELIISDGQAAQNRLDNTIRHCEKGTTPTNEQMKDIFKNAETAANSELIATLTRYLQEGKPIDDVVKQAYTNLELLAKANHVISTGYPILGGMRMGEGNIITADAERPDVTLTKAINALDRSIYKNIDTPERRSDFKAILQKQAINLSQSLAKGPPPAKV